MAVPRLSGGRLCRFWGYEKAHERQRLAPRDVEAPGCGTRSIPKRLAGAGDVVLEALHDVERKVEDRLHIRKLDPVEPGGLVAP